MKKIVLVLLITALLPMIASAVDFTVGPRIALGNMGGMGADKDLGYGPGVSDAFSLSFTGGAFANLQFTEVVGLQAEVSYRNPNWKITDGSIWNKYSINTLNFPVMARFNIPAGDMKVYVLAGLDMSLMFGDVKVKDSLGNDISFPVDTYFDETFLFGIAAGAGVSIPTGPGTLDIGARYTQGLTQMFTDTKFYFYGIDLEVAYGFKL